MSMSRRREDSVPPVQQRPRQTGTGQEVEGRVRLQNPSPIASTPHLDPGTPAVPEPSRGRESPSPVAGPRGHSLLKRPLTQKTQRCRTPPSVLTPLPFAPHGQAAHHPLRQRPPGGLCCAPRPPSWWQSLVSPHSPSLRALSPVSAQVLEVTLVS